MSKKHKNGNDSGAGKAVEKHKHKIRLVKFGDFIVVSLYDLVTWVGIALCVGLVLIYGFQGNQRGVFWTGLVLFVLVLIMLAIRAKQHFFSEDAKPKERAELFIETAKMRQIEPGKFQEISLFVTNMGKRPARNINTGGANSRLMRKSFTGPLEYEPVDSDTRPDLAAETSAIMRARVPIPFTKEQIKLLQDGELLFFHYGKGEYEDDAGGRYPWDYCFMYTPLNPTLMRTCPLRYWPKGGGPTVSAKKRPDLFVEKAAVNLIAGKQIEMSVVFYNRGDETATSLWLEGVTSVRPKDFEGPLDRKGMTRSEVPIQIAPGMPLTAILRESKRWSKRGVTAIKGGKYLLFHYGRGEYGDAAGNTYPIEFCLRYERGLPKSESGLPYMGLCERKFWPKDEEKPQ